jgi:hypothetical protein
MAVGIVLGYCFQLRYQYIREPHDISDKAFRIAVPSFIGRKGFGILVICPLILGGWMCTVRTGGRIKEIL